MMNNIKMHESLCKELHDLYSKKNHDYGDSFHQTFVEEGLAMSRIRLRDKLNRFTILTKQVDGFFHCAVSDESIRDTLLDLANYALMTIIELDREDRYYILKGETFDEQTEN